MGGCETRWCVVRGAKLCRDAHLQQGCGEHHPAWQWKQRDFFWHGIVPHRPPSSVMQPQCMRSRVCAADDGASRAGMRNDVLRCLQTWLAVLAATSFVMGCASYNDAHAENAMERKGPHSSSQLAGRVAHPPIQRSNNHGVPVGLGDGVHKLPLKIAQQHTPYRLDLCDAKNM